MSITEITQIIKSFMARNEKKLLISIIIVLTAIASFYLGRISERKAESLRIGRFAESVGGQVVASRNGSTYFYPWCGSVKAIAEANKIWFDSEEEALQSGYRPAKNCIN